MWNSNPTGGMRRVMFKPNFQYTDKIVGELVQIAAARELVLNSPFIPKWEVSLRREAIIRSAHSSTAIEGNRLSLEQVSDLVYGREIMAMRKDKQEVLNYLKVLQSIDKLTDGKKITEKDILKIHKMVTRNTLENLSDCGVYRKRYAIVGNRLTGEVFFRPPSNEDVPQLMKALITWLNSFEAKALDPVIEAGIAHFFCLDDYYDSDRPLYYRALQSVNQKTLDITKWLEYFVEGVKVSIAAVKESGVRLSSERLRKAKKGQIALTERQMKIVERIIRDKKIAIGDVAKEFEISRQAALKEINKLVGLKVVRLKGTGRGAYYELI